MLSPDFDSDLFVNDNPKGGYTVSYCGKIRFSSDDWGEVWDFVRDWQVKERYWPNKWLIDERGWAELLDNDGNIVPNWQDLD